MNSSIKKIQNRIIDIDMPLLEALRYMDKGQVKLLFVFYKGKFSGLVSIGDIQRAIISNKSFESPVGDIMRIKNTVAYISEDSADIKARLIEHRAECMPILDEEGNLVDVFFWEDIFNKDERYNSSLNMPIVIMAGGQGSRLKPLTNIIPKPLIPLGDKPILELIIDSFSKLGCSDFYLSVNYKQEMIKFYFDSLDNKPYNLNYFSESTPLGTAGSLYLLKDRINTTFFVSNCDIIVDQDYSEIYNYHKDSGNELTIVSALKHSQIPYGTLESGENGQLLQLKEKPELTFMINTGMYILEPHLLKEIPSNTFFHITQLIENIMKRSGKVGVFPVSEGAWMDIGEWKEYNKTMKRLGFDGITLD